MQLRTALVLSVLTALLTKPAAAQDKSLWNIDSLRASPGRAWEKARSSRFVVYSEYPSQTTRAIVDSLEAAWRHDAQLLGRVSIDTTPIVVFVTRSTSRFPRILTPVTKGAAGVSADGRDLILLVHNDSVRVYARHEVMHVLARRAWGLGPPRDGEWFREGLATFADGTCQGVPLIAAARDVLRREPAITAEQLYRDFPALHRTARATSYVVAGSFVAYLWASRGQEGVARLWTGRDSLATSHATIPGFGARGSQTAEDRAWRSWVEREARDLRGLPELAFAQFGCG